MATKKTTNNVEGIDLKALKEMLKAEILKEIEEEKKEEPVVDREALKAELKKELEEEANEIKKESEKQIKVRKKVDLDRLVTVRSVCTGTLTVKTKFDSYSFYEYGAEQDITIGELKALKSSNPKYFTEPMIIIEDEETVELCGLKDFYNKISFINNLPNFFKTATEEDVTKKLNEIPQFLRMEIVTRLKLMWESGEFRDSDVMMYFKKHMRIDISEGISDEE